MWEAPIFGVYKTRAESLERTLREWNNGIHDKVSGFGRPPKYGIEISVGETSIDQCSCF